MKKVVIIASLVLSVWVNVNTVSYASTDCVSPSDPISGDGGAGSSGGGVLPPRF